MSGRRLDASGLLDWAHAAVGGLVVHAEEMNRLNVFPVADADTGTNMLFTMRAALADVTPPAAADTGNECADINAVVFGASLRHAVGLVVGSMGEEVPGTIVS